MLAFSLHWHNFAWHQLLESNDTWTSDPLLSFILLKVMLLNRRRLASNDIFVAYLRQVARPTENLHTVFKAKISMKRFTIAWRTYSTRPVTCWICDWQLSRVLNSVFFCFLRPSLLQAYMWRSELIGTRRYNRSYLVWRLVTWPPCTSFLECLTPKGKTRDGENKLPPNKHPTRNARFQSKDNNVKRNSKWPNERQQIKYHFDCILTD